MNRTEARTEIIQAANREKMRLAPGRGKLIDERPFVGLPDTGLRREPTLFSQRHLQQAVRMCRSGQLVGVDVLRAAGFNALREVV